jgi:hypothetical protein
MTRRRLSFDPLGPCLDAAMALVAVLVVLVLI